MTKKHKILIGIIVVSVLARLALPHILLRAINKKLDHFKGYKGHVRDIDMKLYRGAYTLKGFSLQRAEQELGSIHITCIHLAIEWKSFLHGVVAGRVVFDSLVVQLPSYVADSSVVINELPDFNTLWLELLPVKINRLDVRRGSLLLTDLKTPASTFSIGAITIDAANLLNGYDSTSMLPATIQAKARICNGDFSFFARADLQANKTKLQLHAQLQNADTACNAGFFDNTPRRTQLKIKDFEAEANCREGHYEGTASFDWSTANKQEKYKRRIAGTFGDTLVKPAKVLLILLPRLFMAAWHEPAEIKHKATIKHSHEKKKKGFLNKLFRRKKTDRVPKNN